MIKHIIIEHINDKQLYLDFFFFLPFGLGYISNFK